MTLRLGAIKPLETMAIAFVFVIEVIDEFKFFAIELYRPDRAHRRPVTLQWVAQKSSPPLCVTHAPGEMFVTDFEG